MWPDWPGAPAASPGERYWAPLLWAPRSLLRHRRPRQRGYPVGGLMGCAMLFSRAAWDRVCGFDDTLFAYYEEVDLCLRSRRAGMTPRLEPMAEIAHVGHRGFAAGFTRTAAYLKARNLWLVGRRRAGKLGMLVFVPGYFVWQNRSNCSALIKYSRIRTRTSFDSGAAIRVSIDSASRDRRADDEMCMNSSPTELE